MKNQYSPITLPINTAIGWLFLSHVFEFLALYTGFSWVADISQVFEKLAPYNDLIFLPSNSHELEEVAPYHGFSFLPSHSQSLGNSTLFDICSLLKK